MLVFELWKKITILVVCVFSLLFSLTNFIDNKNADLLPNFLNSNKIRLGLDLQGGSYLLLRVEIDEIKKERLDNLADEIRVAFRTSETKVGYINLLVENGILKFSLINSNEFELANKLIEEIDKDLIVSNINQDQVTIDISEKKMKDLQVTTVLQSIEIIRRRIDEVGTNEPLIQRQGKDRVLVQLPGLEDPERIKRLLGKTARMIFRLVNETASIDDAMAGRVPPGNELLFEINQSTGERSIPYIINKRIGVSGDHLIDASPTVDQYNEPVVSLRFDSTGARKFGDLTAANVGKRFAIILDNEVISAPVIREAIAGGSGQISGNFSFETLPGIAGIALTIGMAVDANVLIFERIREEFRSGRSIISAIDNGFKQALRTIIDANTTTLLAAIILFQFGSGPVKGFAVTLALGVIITMFTAIMFSRGIISMWFNKFKPSKLSI